MICRGSWKDERNRHKDDYWVECSQEDCGSKMHRTCIPPELARQSGAADLDRYLKDKETTFYCDSCVDNDDDED